MKEIPAIAQAEIRNRVIAALNRGVMQAEAARVFGITDRSIPRWVKQMRESGMDHIEPKMRGRAAGTKPQAIKGSAQVASAPPPTTDAGRRELLPRQARSVCRLMHFIGHISVAE